MSDDDRAWFDAQNERAMREYENRGQPEPPDDEESADERDDREAVETLRLQCEHLAAHAVIGGHVTLRREHAERLLRMAEYARLNGWLQNTIVGE